MDYVKIKDVIAAMIGTAVSLILFSLLSPITGRFSNPFVGNFIRQLIFAILVFFTLIILKKTEIYEWDIYKVFDGWTSSFLFIGIMWLTGLQCMTVKVTEPPLNALLFALQMLLVGYCEETLFRGLILNAFHGLFGNTPVAGARLAVLCSGVLFGATHLVNALHPEIGLANAAVQAAAASFLGIYFGAVYIRTGKCLWFVALMHGVNDLLVSVSAGRLSDGTLSEGAIISSYSENGTERILVAAVFYGVTTMIIMRRKKLLEVVE